MHSLKDDNQGVAFVAVMMTMLVLSILSVAALSMTTSNLKNGLEEREFQSTYYIAEGGADYYTEDLKGKILEAYIDADTADDFFDAIESSRLDVTVNESSALYDRQYNSQPEVEMTLKQDGTYGSGTTTRTYIIESIGTLDSKERKVVKPITIEWLEKSSWKTDYAVLTYGDLELTGSTEITGPVYAMGNLDLNGNIKIDGNVYVEGGVNITSSAHVTGDVYALGDVTIDNYSAKVDGNVYAIGSITTAGYIDGDAKAQGGNITITTDSGAKRINGHAYAKGEITNSTGSPGNKAEINIGQSINDNDPSVELPAFPDGPVIPVDGPYPDFPVFPEKEECLQLGSKYYTASNGELTLTAARTYIPTIDVHYTDLTIKYTDKQILMVDEFNVHDNGKVKLEGVGSLRLYVNKKLNLASCPLNYTYSDDKKEIEKTREKIEVYVKDDDVKISGGGANLLTKILYAPEAFINLTGNGNVQGPVIADKVKIDGSKASNITFNPEGPAQGGGGAPPDAEDLVIISPAKEK